MGIVARLKAGRFGEYLAHALLDVLRAMTMLDEALEAVVWSEVERLGAAPPA